MSNDIKQDYEFFMRGVYNIDRNYLMENHYDADSFVEDNLSLLKINIASAILEYLGKENMNFSAKDIESLIIIRNDISKVENLNELTVLLENAKRIVSQSRTL